MSALEILLLTYLLTVMCSQRPLNTGTNTRYASVNTHQLCSKQHAWNYFTQIQIIAP